MKYIVKTHDVDGSTRRVFKTREGAWKRFEEMLGYTAEVAIAEQYHSVPAERRPTRETVEHVRYVSMYGTVVSFAVRRSEEDTLEDK